MTAVNEEMSSVYCTYTAGRRWHGWYSATVIHDYDTQRVTGHCSYHCPLDQSYRSRLPLKSNTLYTRELMLSFALVSQ